MCADNADHHGLRAWIRATPHFAALLEHHFLDAAHYAEDGLRYAATGSAEAFLASALAADRAVAAFEQTPAERRNAGSEHMARALQVRRHVALGQLDGAVEVLSLILDTPAEHRVRPLLQRLDEVHTQALTCPQRDEPALRGLREAITDFRRQAVVAELTG